MDALNVTQFGKWTVDEKLALSRMALVYKVRKNGSSRKAVLKTPCSLLEKDLAFFRRECEITGELGISRYFPRFIEASTVAPPYYLVMNNIPGVSFRTHFLSCQERSLLKNEFAFQIKALYGAAIALEKMHEGGFIHNDIKLGNFIRKPRGRVILFDFGIARRGKLSIQGGREILIYEEHSPTVRGTPLYMAPELYSSKEYNKHVMYSSLADVWSFGITSYLIFSGISPFRDDSISCLSHSIRSDTPKSIPSLDKKVMHLIYTALEKQRKNRPTMRELRQELGSRMDEFGINYMQ